MQLALKVQDSEKITNAGCFMTHIFYFLSYDEEDSHCFLMEAKAEQGLSRNWKLRPSIYTTQNVQ